MIYTRGESEIVGVDNEASQCASLAGSRAGRVRGVDRGNDDCGQTECQKSNKREGPTSVGPMIDGADLRPD